jgi:hypothetical protein
LMVSRPSSSGEPLWKWTIMGSTAGRSAVERLCGSSRR